MKRIAIVVLLVGLGLASGYLYFAISDLMILALLALAIAMAAGAARPSQPWLWALLLSFSIPSAAVIIRWEGLPVQSGRLESALVASLASGFLGAYAGAMMRRMLARAFGSF